MSIKLILKKIGFCFWISTFLTSAWAYIPSAEFILKTALQSRTITKPIKIKSVVFQWENQKITSLFFSKQTYFHPVTHLIKTLTFDSKGQLVSVFETHLDKRNLILNTMFSQNLEKLTTLYRENGIRIKTEAELLKLSTELERMRAEVSHFGRLDGSYAWVLGEKDQNQVWVEKNQIRIMRLLTQNDIKFYKYKNFKEVSFPTEIYYGIKNSSPQFLEKIEEVFFDNVKDFPAKQTLSDQVTGEVRDLVSRYYDFLK